MEGVTTGDLSVAEAARGYDETLEEVTDGQVVHK
jgi:multiple sugar transport system substrate-binding protein